MRREPLRSQNWHPVDRWYRTLADGSEVFAALWRHGPTSGSAEEDGALYMDLAFTSGDARVVSPIAEQVMAVLGPKQGHYPWRRLAAYGAQIDSHKSRTKGKDE